MVNELQTFPHAYTEGDELPSIVAAFPFDISSYSAFTATVERPDGTAFERLGTVLNESQVQFNWTDSDWIAGCSQMTIEVVDGGGQGSHLPPILIQVRPKPQEPTP